MKIYKKVIACILTLMMFFAQMPVNVFAANQKNNIPLDIVLVLDVSGSMEDPITSNETNISGFLNMLTAARDANVKRFIYAASSSTYGDSQSLPKVEDVIGKPLSPYAITKYVNELYADVFAKTY